jgi:putative thioredoxin
MDMDTIIGGATGQGGADPVKDGTDASFAADVLDASREVPVIVDFWATWCGPCKQLGPALERAVRAERGAVKLVKIDTDKNPRFAAQLGVQSIPAVYAFFQGRPVDGFVGAVPESSLKQFVKRLTQLGGAEAGGGPSPIEEALAMAKEALAAGDAAAAANLYTQILQHEPENVEAIAGLARTAIDRKDLARARQVLEKAPTAAQSHAEIAAARAALELAEAGEKAAGALGEYERRLAGDPNDHAARLELASALFAAGRREEAVEHLLTLVRKDRAWNEEAARKQLVKLFEAMGPTDPLTVATRRRLSSILFS